MSRIAPELCEKTPFEDFPYDFNFSGVLVGGETVASVQEIVSTPTGVTIGSSSISSPKVQVRLSGGTVETDYLMSCKILTSAGNKRECEGKLKVTIQ